LKKQLNLFSKVESHIPLKEIFKNYKIIFRSIVDLQNSKNDLGGLIFNNDNWGIIKLNNFKKKYLVVTNTNPQINSLKNNIKVMQAPSTLNDIKNNMEKFLLNKELHYKDIIINDKKLSNFRANKTCYLTEIENDIMTYLIQSDSTSKNHIKEHILNIKSALETNSLESHLTRIRKKLIKIESKLVITSKFNKIILKY